MALYTTVPEKIEEMKNSDNIRKKLKKIYKALEQNYGDNLSVSGKLLDSLYAVLQDALPCEDVSISLDAAEHIKYAYGLCRAQNKIRFNECNNWRKIALIALANKQFQVLEYLLEGAKILLQAPDTQKITVIETFKILANASCKDRKFFIAASIVKILTSFLPKLEKEPDIIASAIMTYLNNIGCLAINYKQYAFFQEICMLVMKNLPKVDKMQEDYLDKMLYKWLKQILKCKAVDSLYIWLHFLSYCEKKQNNSNLAFYAELIQITSIYCGKIDKDILQKINRRFVRRSFVSKNQVQNILTVKALANAYNKTLNNFDWQTANYIYDIFYIRILCLIDKMYIRNKIDVCDRAICQIYFEAIKKAASFCSITMKETDMQDVLNIWQQVFLFKYKSIKSKKCVEILFALLTK